jgi:Kef-type K+ transport system membrane component KefB
MQDLESLAIIWTAVFVAHYLAGKTRLTPALWFLAMGCLLVNVGILPEDPGIFLQDLSQLGIIVIMFALGFEESSSSFVRSIKRSWGIAFFGALVPFAVAYSVVFERWGDANAALMCGLAMTATAVSLTMVSLRSEGLSKTSAATGIMTSAVLDDIASLALVAILVPIAAGDATLNAMSLVIIALKAVMFFVLITGVALWLFPVTSGPLKNIPLLKHFSLRYLITMHKGEHATLTVLLLALLVALLGHAFGFHPAVGAYMAGLILSENYFAHEDHTEEEGRAIYYDTRRIVDNVAFSWIGPVFFVVLGGRLVIHPEIMANVIDETIILTAGLFVGQVLSAGLAARFTGNFQWAESWMIGFGMLGRAELAFVVMDIAFTQEQIINDEMFYTLMFTAFFLNVLVPVTIRLWKPRFMAEAQATPPV